MNNNSYLHRTRGVVNESLRTIRMRRRPVDGPLSQRVRRGSARLGVGRDGPRCRQRTVPGCLEPCRPRSWPWSDEGPPRLTLAGAAFSFPIVGPEERTFDPVLGSPHFGTVL